MKNVLAILLISMLLFSLTISACGLDATTNEDVVRAIAAQKEMEMIDEWIALAADAASNGNYELATHYEDLLQTYGVKIVATDYFDTAMYLFDMDDSVSPDKFSNPYLPDDTRAIHWYQHETTGFYNYYGGGNYDLISITATCWDGSNSLMYRNGLTYSNPKGKSFSEIAILTAAESLVDIATGGGYLKTGLITLLDIKNKYEESNLPYTTVEIPANNLVVVWWAERSIRYWYVRPNGSGKNHVLVCAADMYIGDYQCSTTLRSYDTEGKVYTDILTKMINDVSIYSEGYGDMAFACEAYRDALVSNNMTTSEVGDVFISFMGNFVIIPSLDLPVTPRLLEDS